MEGCGGESQGWQVSPAGVRGVGGPCHLVQGRGCVSLAEPESAALQGPEVVGATLVQGHWFWFLSWATSTLL